MKNCFLHLLISAIFTIPQICIGQSIAGNEKVVKNIRNISDFSAISIEGGVTVFLIQDDSTNLLLKIDENLDTVIATEVINGTLKVYPTLYIRYFKTMEVYVTFVEIYSLKVTDYSDVKSDSVLNLNSLTITCNEDSKVDIKVNANLLECDVNNKSDIHISGNIKEANISANTHSNVHLNVISEIIACNLNEKSEALLKGKCESVSINAIDGSDILSAGLKAKHCDVDVDIGSDAEVYASQSIKITANGGSDIIYEGNPQKKDIQNCEDCEIIAR